MLYSTILYSSVMLYYNMLDYVWISYDIILRQCIFSLKCHLYHTIPCMVSSMTSFLSYKVIFNCIMLFQNTLHYIMLFYVMPYYTILCYAILHLNVWSYRIVFHIVLYYAMLYSISLDDIILRCVILHNYYITSCHSIITCQILLFS